MANSDVSDSLLFQDPYYYDKVVGCKVPVGAPHTFRKTHFLLGLSYSPSPFCAVPPYYCLRSFAMAVTLGRCFELIAFNSSSSDQEAPAP